MKGCRFEKTEDPVDGFRYSSFSGDIPTGNFRTLWITSRG